MTRAHDCATLPVTPPATVAKHVTGAATRQQAWPVSRRTGRATGPATGPAACRGFGLYAALTIVLATMTSVDRYLTTPRGQNAGPRVCGSKRFQTALLLLLDQD